VALALKVPVFFVVTKVDICPEHVLKNTVQVGAATGCAGGEERRGVGEEEGGMSGGTRGRVWRVDPVNQQSASSLRAERMKAFVAS